MDDDSGSLKILIADDNETDRMILKAIVTRQGHEVVTASDGLEAVERFIEDQPELILLDALMPNMDGFEAARRIKELAGEDLVPIIFLTSLKEAESLAKCLEAGGDDFLSKPYNRIILKAKINAFRRMRNMHLTLQKQRDQIAQHNEHLLHEQETAKTVFDNVAHSGCLDSPNIKYLLSPLAVFNGDVLLAARKPSGGMHVLLGDYTGHGLPAAIGAMPMAEIFYALTSKGFTIEEIIKEINSKLKAILPTGVFCCACMLDVEFREREMKVWIGGLPSCVLYRSETGECVELASNHLPLGVLSNDQFKVKMQVFEVSEGDRVFMWSDGIHEARNDQDVMFGEERLMAVFDQCKHPDQLFDSIHDSVESFLGKDKRDDDITLVEVRIPNQVEVEALPEEFIDISDKGPMDWFLDYRLNPLSLKYFNPLPFVLQLITEVPGLRRCSGQVYTILAELFSNALEHGVLKLDSDLKKNPQGFSEYYEMRSKRLENLSEGYVNFELNHIPTETGGQLTVIIRDSGEGFDFKDKMGSDDKQYCGRGIPLISSLCRSVEYRGKGNEVEVVFEWHYQQTGS
ncbi:ATP-binding SpoIIE family protein phosphatase [Litoribrevibacter albus]|uniref:Fused response regulator/phosphatase n=1 Tax=Litoribrevibacter albus TaxID=1473156 RepID=A0AA37SBK7_9GAMM|nr:fused response regulator/phosphatase [Litoribrevibacter albus]GLQ32341.1 fused response regulator/phosphatase [Litoribrevibacter albus]